MLQTKERCEQNTTGKNRGLFPSQNQGQDEKTVKEPIVLEVNVVDNQQGRRKQD